MALADTILPFLAHHWPTVTLALLALHLARNYFHNSLHKYPGPTLASLTNWWRFFVVCGRRPDITHQRLHQAHGPVVRLGPNSLSFSDPKALKTIYGLNKGFIKSDFYVVQQAVARGRRLASLFSTTDNDFHARFRRCVNSAFAMSSLVSYEPFVDNTTRLFLRRTGELHAGEAKGCDLPRWLQFYAFDVIGEITYGKRHGFLEGDRDVDGIVGYLGKLFLYVAPVGQIPGLDLLGLKNPLYLQLARWGLVDATFPVAKFARDRMAERMPGFGEGGGALLPVTQTKQKEQPPDLLSKFIAAREARPEFMTDTLVETMAVSMAFAGSETTAISLSAVFYYLLRNPGCLERLREEIDSAARDGLFSDHETGLVTWHEAQKLAYLEAVVKEAFRMHPAAGLPLERIVPEPGMDIAGNWVKGGTIVGCSAWVIHRNKDIFGEDADVYRPERWFPDPARDGEEETKRIKNMDGHMFQFGMGSRTCIGKNISLLEIYKVVPSILRRFEIRLHDPSQEWKLTNAWFVKQSNFEVNFDLRPIIKPEKTVEKDE